MKLVRAAAVAREAARPEAQILAQLDDEGAPLDGLAHADPRGGAQPAVARAVSTAVLARLDRPRRLRALGSGRGPCTSTSTGSS